MSWLQRLFARKRMEIDLDKELHFHFEAQVADKVRSGIPESEARRLTRLEFGGMEQIKEDCRERRGAAPVLVLSYPAWQSDFAGDPTVVGSTVYVETHPLTVVGIMPPGFFGDRIVERPPDLWTPLSNEPSINGVGTSLWPQGDEDTAWLYLLGRVRPQTSVPALQAKLSVILRQWMFAHVKFTAHGGAAKIPRQHVFFLPEGAASRHCSGKPARACEC
jgi:MacB-like periplasmic core domain